MNATAALFGARPSPLTPSAKMDIIFLLIPLALVLVVFIVWVFLWAVRSDQFDDLEGPAHRILMDDDEPMIERKVEGKQSNKKIEPD
jgi:cbb3-type cytochrome oxidase maturation protein